MIRLDKFLGAGRWVYCSRTLPATAEKWCFCRRRFDGSRRLDYLTLTPQRGEALVRAQEATLRDEFCDGALTGRRLMMSGHMCTVGSYWERRGTRVFWLIPDNEGVPVRAVSEAQLRVLLWRAAHGS